MSAQRCLWRPSKQFIQNANLTKYNHWLRDNHNLAFDSYDELWEWSVSNPADFWESIADFFEVAFYNPPKRIISNERMPEVRWFEGATLNYAEHIFRQKNEEHPAILFASEQRPTESISWPQLEERTAALQAFLIENGVRPGDRIVGYMPNIPQATTSFLAANSIGAIWSSCSPDFGSGSVLDRFKQIKPKILITVDGYRYGGKTYDREEAVRTISRELPSVEKVICIPYLNEKQDFKDIGRKVLWEQVMATKHGDLSFTPVPFSHPIWVLYSSGTTGKPKAITHSHGGMLLEHLKYLSLHNDVHPGENFFWFSTTGWMMWNFTQAALLIGATIVLYDGSAGYNRLNILWQLAAELPIHHFGTSAPYIMACQKADKDPGKEFDLSALRSIGSTGSPLPPEGFDYIYAKIKPDLWLCSMSGGTDICTALVGGNPWKPVYEGEIQSRALGCALYAFDESGEPVYNEVGEMVITRPMPCMPIYFWNDKDFERYTASYFEMYPGIWRHGDWVEITSRGGVVIQGRSDTTLNRQGVRIGTAEVYRAVNKVAEVKDSLVVNVELPRGDDYMPLFVLMREKNSLSEEIKKRLRRHIRKECSPRHVPDKIIEVSDIPYTISGKKMEAPVKKILMGKPVDEAANKGAMKNPECLKTYQNIAAKEIKRL